ncbi:penicillin-binding protein 1C [Roseiterribacter gracilis]|uniref:peptidoglycan glycosyltransferase n=1 Tax=Roseiterribacter gracilis TaxID=2812848 RepID=A0A8S8XK89_9PROT|nr:penicillin-binding protein 1C [Rhodospirillales bacterium TMPK1]
MSLRRAQYLAASLGALLFAPVALLALDRACPPDLTRVQTRSVLLTDARGEALAATLVAPGRLRLGATDLPPLLPAMLRAVEDKRFDLHPGVDPLSVVRATFDALRHGRVTSGASTLTMQVARLAMPHRRSLAGKAGEALRALQLTHRLGRDGVLDAYFTLAPYGGNVEGIAAGAFAWFGKAPHDLDLAEIALLVALPQSPERLRPDRHPDAAHVARARVLDRALAAGLIDADSARIANSAPLPTAQRVAPALTQRLAERIARSDSGTIRTSLDAELQRAASLRVAESLRGRENGTRGAAIVLDIASGTVRAWVANAGSGDGAALDLARARRSPGSTLKPFVYAIAFAHQIATPDTRIDDAPIERGAYRPRNFASHWNGELSAREALQRSLNGPVLRLAAQLGPQAIAAKLADGGFDGAVRAHAGLPLVLGGVGATLEQLVAGYAALARDGRVAPVSLATDATPRSWLDSNSARQVAEILRRTKRPAGATRANVSFKTGTSAGYHDAWAIGFDAKHVVGVWVGRADGAPCLGCVGIDAAAPLLFQLFDLLPDGGAVRAPAPPQLRVAAKRAVRPLAIAFPVDGTILPFDADAQLPLEARDGRAPIRWFVDGRPIASDTTRWTPDGAGWSTITAIDADGVTARTRVFFER